jgi:MFS family permease
MLGIMKKWIVIIILALSQFVMILDSTVMNVSISTVAKDLGTTVTGMQVAITFYALTMASLMLTGGKLGDIWGRRRAFRIGSIIYGVGSLITALTPSLGVLLFGWSLVEGLGAVLVIPAIAALAAANYSGKDRVVAFSILGAVTGLAAAVGPLIGGLVTTYFSWRYVFAAETIIMIIVLLVSGKIRDEKTAKRIKLDIPSVIQSAAGMSLLVFGVLQTKVWGLVDPKQIPEIAGHQIVPFGISIVAYLILAGIIILWAFYRRQAKLEAAGRDALLKVSMLKISSLRGGLMVLLTQYFIIAAVFFVIPVYLQTILGYDALQTGLKLMPLSLGLIVFAAVGSKLTAIKSPRYITRIGQIALVLGSLLLLGSVEPDLRGALFWIGMLVIGIGFGLLASQIGNINMSAVSKKDSAEVGGLQGTFQNLGSSFGTALVGSIFMIALSTGFVNSIQASPDLSQDAKVQITQQAKDGIEIVSQTQIKQYAVSNGASQQSADTIGQVYEDSQIKALKDGLFFVFASAILALMLSRNLPNKVIKSS